MKRRINKGVAAALTACLLLLSGCGSEKNNNSSNNTTSLDNLPQSSSSQIYSEGSSSASKNESSQAPSQEGSENSNQSNSSQSGKPPASQPNNTSSQSTSSNDGKKEESLPEQLGGISNTVTVTAPGVLVKSSDSAVIDYSNSSDGYVMIKYLQKTSNRLKVQLKGPKTTYTYNLTPEKWTAFPLTDENGSYKITVLQNTSGTKYAALLTLNIDITLKNEFAPFLHSNQFVDFDSAPKTVAKAKELTNGVSDPLTKVKRVYDFVVKHLSYDKQLALSVQSGYLPDLDKTLAAKKGICFDYAALMTGMLRSQNVPTKLVVGYAGDVYHAWISVWSEKEGWIDAAIYFDGITWKRMDPTFASSGGGGKDVMNYIGNGSNYSPKYFY